LRFPTAKRYVPLTVVLALACAAVLAVVSPVSAAPPIVGSTTTTAATPVSTPEVTPGGDLVAKPATPVSTLPPVMVKAKSFARDLYVRKEIRHWQRAIRQYRRSAEKWAQIRGAHIPRLRPRALAAAGLPALRHLLVEYRKLDNQQRLLTQHPPHLADWMCIHHYEASWHYDKDAPGHNGKYDDGLQMDLTFQNDYAHRLLYSHGVDRFGNPIWTGDHWTPLEQIWTAEKAQKTRGFWPWPNSARLCGLLP
jgi:hypothetical protein